MCVQVMKTANRFEISSLLEKILLKQVRWCLTFVGLYSLSELFKYGKLLHKICISFTKRHLSLMYKGHSNRKCIWILFVSYVKLSVCLKWARIGNKDIVLYCILYRWWGLSWPSRLPLFYMVYIYIYILKRIVKDRAISE
jgi:hypothetical protein